MATTVLLVDDHDLIRQGLRQVFGRHPDFTVVGDACSVRQALRLSQELDPDVVVCDIRLPDGSGLDVVRRLRSRDPDIGLVILTMYAGDEHLFAALEAGASAFVPKDAPAGDVVTAARHAVVSPTAFTAPDLAGAMKRRLKPSGPQLSPRESEVLALLAQGFAVAPIARRLFISDSTTKTHVHKIYEKLGATNRAQAIMKAVQTGLIRPEMTTAAARSA